MPAPPFPRRSPSAHGVRRGPFDELCDRATLAFAARRAVRGKRRRGDVAWFLFRRESVLLALRESLLDESWRPAKLRLKRIRDPKPRPIACPCIEDRVVHRAMVDVIAPRFDRSLMPHDFACRPGHGAHRAVLHLQRAMQRHRFVLHLDVKAYFASIDPGILVGLVAARLPDPRFLAVLDAVLQQGPPLYRRADVRAFAGLDDGGPPPGRGIPIGTAVSQYLAAHVYLLAFDHWLKRALKVPAACRYVDDIFCFGDRRRYLERWRDAIAGWLSVERGLKLKHPQAPVLSCRGSLDALGYRITRDGRRALPRARRRAARRVDEAMAGRARVDMRRSLASTVGVELF